MMIVCDMILLCGGWLNNKIRCRNQQKSQDAVQNLVGSEFILFQARSVAVWYSVVSVLSHKGL